MNDQPLLPPLARFTYVDLVRGAAAISVLLFHYAGFLGPTASVAAPLPWRAALWPAYRYGGYAVQLFWLLSGIVFMTVYGQQPVGGREFFMRRFARLYPLHFATLLIMVALDITSRHVTGSPFLPANDFKHFVLQLFMASNWSRELEHSFNFPIWSVSIEMLAYAAFFVVMRARQLAFWRVVIIAAVCTALALATARYSFTCLALFFIGAALVQLPQRLGRAHIPAAVFGLTAAVALAMLVGHSSISRHTGLVVSYAVFPALLLGVLAMELRAPPVPRRLHWIGDSTYSIYLLHIPVQTAMLLAMGAAGVEPPASSPWMLLAYVGAVLMLAAGTFRFFERPAQRMLLRRQATRTRPDPVTAAP